ncbi:phage distal tail protein [Nonomuraea angiospora]
MAIDPHASSPAIVTGNPSAQTAQFSPPANSVLVACVFANDGSSGTNITVSNNVSALTWTSRVRRDTVDSGGQNGLAAIFTAPCPAGITNTRVTAATNRTTGIGVKVYVFTGVDLTTPVGATGEGSSPNNAINPNAYTSTAAGSRGVACASERSDTGAPTSTDDAAATYNGTLGLAGMGVLKAANTGSSGSTVQFNLDASGGLPAEWNWCAVELMPGATDTSVELVTVAASAAVPSPGVSAGAGPTPATVTATTAVPAPTASGDANATPATVTARAAVPAPAVTTDSATVANLTTVTAAAAVPAPTVQTDISLTPATVQAAATVWGLTVQADFNADVTLPHVAVTTAVDGVVASVPALPGDNMSGQPGQIEFGGFLLGTSTPYRWKTLTGWREKPPIDSGNVPRASRHGSYAGRPLMQERVITWTANLRAPRGEVEAAVVALELALPVYADERESPLVINDLGTPYLIYGRIDRNPIVVDQRLRLGFSQLTLQWICSDPRRYNLLATGVTVPINEDRTIGNGGNSETHPLLVVKGPVVGPVVVNETMQQQVAFDVTLDADDELVIDCDLGNATIAGANVIGQLTGASVHPSYFVLDRGNNTISHTATSGGAQVEVLYRDAWA